MALLAEPDSGADPHAELERRRRRLEKLRWQLRVARRAVGATRKKWADLGLETPPSRFDKTLVWGLTAGGAAGVVLTQVLWWMVMR